MPDMEKVIKEFADYVHYFKPYCIGDIEDHAMLKDVIELLKEREAVEPNIRTETIKVFDYKIREQIAECGNCGRSLIMPRSPEVYIYCPKCGRRVNWG